MRLGKISGGFPALGPVNPGPPRSRDAQPSALWLVLMTAFFNFRIPGRSVPDPRLVCCSRREVHFPRRLRWVRSRPATKSPPKKLKKSISASAASVQIQMLNALRAAHVWTVNPHHTSRPPANVRPAPTLQKMILSPSEKMPSSAAQPKAMETLAALVFPYLEIVTTNLS